MSLALDQRSPDNLDVCEGGADGTKITRAVG